MTTAFTLAFATVGFVIGGFMIYGLVMLFRNREGAKPTSAAGLPALRSKSNVKLVALDEALQAADNELGFAIAQFGEEATADYALAVRQSRGIATAAFRLRRELEDAFPEPVTKQREMTLQIIALSDAAQDTLDQLDRTFSTLRSEEVEAPASLKALAARIAATTARVAPARTTLKRLAEQYRPDIVAEHERAIGEATERLDAAAETVKAAQKKLSPAGVNDVVSSLHAAEDSVTAATGLLDSIDAVATKLDDAANAVKKMATAQKADLVEARKEREEAPDAMTGKAILDAIDGVETVVSAVSAEKEPVDPLTTAIARLEWALASARNQTQRLDHAKTALAGTLVVAKSQITAVRGFILAGGGAAGADARTRLNEAERELKLAEAEADPVDALDAARRAVTHARDADALARYNAVN
jgi:chromosome segregation ATPase